MAALLEVRDLVKRYEQDGAPALDGVTLSVLEGEFVAVLGLSGAGKSTLIRCVNGLVKPSGGQVQYRGRAVEKASGSDLRAVRREVAMVFQGFNLIERLTVLQNVLVGHFGQMGFWQAVLGRYSADQMDAAYRALQLVGVESHAPKRVTELSGGQRQRVAIARALVQNPKLMLADEPVSNLDPLTARQILQLLAQINREQGITMLVNLHSVELVQEFATRVIGIAGGRVVFDGRPADLTPAVLSVIYPAEQNAR